MRSDGDAQGGEPKEIECLTMRVPRSRMNTRMPGGDDPDRHIDVEYPPPVVVLGQPTAQHRAADRAQHHANAPDRDRLAVPLRRVDLQQHRLRQRHQPGAANALQQTNRSPSSVRLVALPHKAEAMVNPTTENRNTYLMPNRPASHPVSGIVIAAATMYEVRTQAIWSWAPTGCLGYAATRRWRSCCRRPA